MKKTLIGLLVAGLSLAPATSAFAQDEGEEEEEFEDEGEEGEEGEEGDEGAGDELDELDELEGLEELGGAEGGGEAGLGDICEIDPEACPQVDFDKEAQRDLKEEIYAVQQIFALRVRRVELQPYYGITLNDPFVSHNAPGLAANYWITNVMAVGINGNFYKGFNNEKDFNADVRRAARVGIPLNIYRWNANVNFTYVPALGKFAGFGDFIFQYDAYVVGGVGAIQTKPIPVIDPDNRKFGWQTNVAFNAGIGLRILFTRWFAAILEVRDYIFADDIENTEIAVNAQDQSTWFGDSKITNNVQAQFGVAIFIPFSFEYRLPK